jgi:SAM-dependent methyltransferase
VNPYDPTDPKRVVADGYDRAAERHEAWSGTVRSDERERYLALLLERVPVGAPVLELGCGAGGATTQRLAARFALTGVDIAPRHIALARERNPAATFLLADMTTLTFAPASFDAVTAFYSLIHVPRGELAPLFQSIASWLRPGGLLVASLGTRAGEASYEPDWLGVPMFFSAYDTATNLRLIAEAGLEIERAREETADEDGVPVTFHWIVARKPVPPTGSTGEETRADARDGASGARGTRSGGGAAGGHPRTHRARRGGVGCRAASSGARRGRMVRPGDPGASAGGGRHSGATRLYGLDAREPAARRL